MKKVTVNGVEAELESGAEVFPAAGRLMVRTADGLRSALVRRKGAQTHISFAGRTYIVEKVRAGAGAASAAASGDLRAPMPGQVVAVLAAEGDTVEAGDKIVVLEAMKMQQPLAAPFAGVVVKLSAEVGQQVDEGAVLAQVRPLEDH